MENYTNEMSGIDSYDGMCSWGICGMDDLQEFVKQRVSTTVLGMLENRFINAPRMEEHENIRSLVLDCVGSAFREFKERHVYREPGRITELHEEPEEIADPADAPKYENDAISKSTTSLVSTMSPIFSNFPTTLSEYTDISKSSESFTLMNDSTLSGSPEHMDLRGTNALSNSWLPEPAELLGSQFFQEHLSNPTTASSQQEDYPLVSFDPAFYCHGSSNMSQEAEGGIWIDLNPANYQIGRL